MRHLHIIGEACRKLSDELRSANPDVPWKDIIGMRNVLVHDYFLVDLEVVWTAATTKLDPLKIQVERMLSQFPTD